MNEDDTRDLIDRLSADLSSPGEAHGLKRRLALGWAGFALGFGVLMAVLAVTWPEHALLLQNVGSQDFVGRAALWLALFLLAAKLAYRSVVPLTSARRLHVAFAVVAAALFVATWAMRVEGPIWTELARELDPERGPCGLFIGLTGATAGFGIFTILRAGLAGRPAVTGIWSGLAAGALGSFFMNLLCRHETTAHVMLWHFLPIALVAVAIGILARNLVLR